MKRPFSFCVAVVTAFVLLGSAVSMSAQEAKTEPLTATPVHGLFHPGTVIIPKSSQPQNAAVGQKLAAHTNVRFFSPDGLTPDEAPPFSGYAFETPASLACHYGLVSTSAAPSCNPNLTTVNPTGGSKSIAIVDAYDDPSARNDLGWFSSQFGIPLTSSQFEVVWANTANSSCSTNGVPVDFTGGWELEEALDIEWSHAMAPGAKIYLVEACSNYNSDLQQAVLVANNLVQCGETRLNPTTGALGKCPAGSAGKGEVSMSWGGGEYLGENGSDGCAILDDSCFTTPGIVYFAAAGDGPGVIYPSASPNVVAAGGTTVRRSPYTGNFESEAAWVDGGGGTSALEPRPSYQADVEFMVGPARGVPDLSFDADLNTGVWVYDTFPYEGTYSEWFIVGGTSVAAPSLAGIVNRAGSFAASSHAELTNIYDSRWNLADFTDITQGFCGPYMGFSAQKNWDFCTGVGVDKGYGGK